MGCYMVIANILPRFRWAASVAHVRPSSLLAGFLCGSSAHSIDCEARTDAAEIAGGRVLRLVQLLKCLAQSLFPKRSFLLRGLHDRLAPFVANGEVSTMLDEQWYSVVVDGREDRRFTVCIARIHIGAKLQQLLFYIGEESFMQRRISVIIACIHIGTGFNQKSYTFRALTFLNFITILTCGEHGSFSLTIALLKLGMIAKNFAHHLRIPRFCGINQHTPRARSAQGHTARAFDDSQLAEIGIRIGAIPDQSPRRLQAS